MLGNLENFLRFVKGISAHHYINLKELSPIRKRIEVYLRTIENLPSSINVNRSYFLSKVDEVYFRVVASDNLLKGLKNHFSYFSDGYIFHPAYKAGHWNGRVSLIKKGKSPSDPTLLPIGLFDGFKEFVKSKGFEYHTLFDESDLVYAQYTDADIDIRCKAYFKEGFALRDYQISPIRIALNQGRAVFEIGTGGGKSATQYAMIRCMMEELPQDSKVLMVIPNLMLIDQIFADFKDYGWLNIESDVDILTGKTSLRQKFKNRILISTWQSLQNKDAEFFEKYGSLIVDECFHGDTMITMADGTYKKISEIKIGELVLSYNEQMKSFEPSPVMKIHENLFKSNSSKMLELVMDTGEIIHVTENHLFMTNRGWVTAGELTQEDYTLGVNYCRLKLLSKKIIERPDIVYDLEVYRNHTYIANGAVVHNCHGSKALVLQEVMGACVNAKYRIGLTGTLPKPELDRMTIFSYLGQKSFEKRADALIAEGVLCPVKVVGLLLGYPEKYRKLIRNLGFASEEELVENYPNRNNVISKIISHIKPDQNTLVLMKKINHLEEVAEQLRVKFPDRIVHIIHGKINDREDIRQQMEKQGGQILVATYQTLSTGVNIKRLHHVIFASSYKAKIKILQSIGRSLRTHESKDRAVIWDLVDDIRDMSNPKRIFKNAYFRHFEERVDYYTEQGFELVIKSMELEPDELGNKLE